MSNEFSAPSSDEADERTACESCGTSFDDCTARLRDRGACCARCRITDTHNDPTPFAAAPSPVTGDGPRWTARAEPMGDDIADEFGWGMQVHLYDNGEVHTTATNLRPESASALAAQINAAAPAVEVEPDPLAELVAAVRAADAHYERTCLTRQHAGSAYQDRQRARITLANAFLAAADRGAPDQ